MAQYRSIEIDLAVHKRIEMAREAFDESDNAVLRRLLGLADNAAAQMERPSSQPKAMSPLGRAWFGKGIELPRGTKVRMDYNGVIYDGEISDGAWIVNGKKFGSPSGACRIARTKDGRPAILDGWRQWEVLRPADKNWVSLRFVRNQTVKSAR